MPCRMPRPVQSPGDGRPEGEAQKLHPSGSLPVPTGARGGNPCISRQASEAAIQQWDGGRTATPRQVVRGAGRKLATVIAPIVNQQRGLHFHSSSRKAAAPFTHKTTSILGWPRGQDMHAPGLQQLRTCVSVHGYELYTMNTWGRYWPRHTACDEELDGRVARGEGKQLQELCGVRAVDLTGPVETKLSLAPCRACGALLGH